MIKLSVALPIYRGKYIAWLALESLCNQKHINFEWELIVIEEEFENFSREKIMKYSKRLKKIGCFRISYTQLKQWIPLSQKWKLIGEKVSNTSEVYVFQAGDDYSQPYRLIETYDIIINQDYDWVSSPIGPFYDIKSEYLVVFDKRKSDSPAGLNMAIKPYFIKGLPKSEKRSSVDGFIVKNSMIFCKKVNNREFKTKQNENENWKYGVYTNGFNNISKVRFKQMKEHEFFNKHIKISLNEILPVNIITKLKECKKYCRREYVLSKKFRF